MSRRSARLVSGGYYPDEDSDSSSVISYRENPVRVVKRKAGSRKSARPPPSSQASSNVGSPSSESAVLADQNNDPALQSSQNQGTMRTVPYVATYVTPRPALVPSTAPAPGRSQITTHSVAAPPERSPSPGLYGSSRAECHHGSQQQLNQRGIDSSGYSSSEDHYRRVAVNISRSSSSSPSRSISSVVAAAQEQIMFLTAQANASFNTGMKKALFLLLFLIIAFLSVWFLSFLLTSVSKTPTSTVSKSQPVLSAFPPSSPPKTTPPTPVVDPAVVSALVEEKMQSLLGELLLKQESLFSQIEERLQVEQRLQMDLQSVRARMEAVDTDNRVHLEREVAGLSRQLADYYTDFHSATSSLSQRVKVVEGQSVKLTQELSSIQMRPSSAPCPDPSNDPHHNQLTSELQQAMEKWFADRVKQGMSRLGGKEECSSNCGRPMADRMADFALESQGASVVSTRCSETYRIRSACVTLFGFPLWYPSESPRTVIQGYPVLLPGKCWAFHGVQGTLLISLSHPVRISHVTLDHLSRCNSPTGRIDSAPKDFHVYGMINDAEEGMLLGNFTYDQDGESTQTFEIPNPTDVVYRFVELRVQTNWGHMEYTCVYRFRVHGKMASM